MYNRIEKENEIVKEVLEAYNDITLACKIVKAEILQELNKY